MASLAAVGIPRSSELSDLNVWKGGLQSLHQERIASASAGNNQLLDGCLRQDKPGDSSGDGPGR